MLRIKNWKTTFAGFAIAFVNLWSNGISIKSAIFSALLATFGTLMKDYDVR